MIYVNRCKERSQDNMGYTTDVRAQVFSKTQRDLAYDYGQGNSIKTRNMFGLYMLHNWRNI